MANGTRQRRAPVQARSRATVTRILDAASALVEEAGVEAATTRAIADRAGVAYPSLYRFFADRDEILDQLLERHLTDLDARVLAEQIHRPASVEDLINHELDLHIAYYQAQPSTIALWFGGRHSQAVLREVRQRNQALATRVRDTLVAAELIPSDTDPQIFHMLVELGDRVLDLAFRDGPTFDATIIELGRTALIAYIRDALAKSMTRPAAPRPS